MKLIFLALILFGGSADIRPVHWTLLGAQGARAVKAGNVVDVGVQADIAPGWHIYSLSQKPGGPIPLHIELAGAADVAIRGKIRAPRPERAFDKNFGLETEVYSGKARFEIPVGVPRGTLSGVRKFEIAARYQVCSDKLCLPARTEKLPVQINIARHAR